MCIAFVNHYALKMNGVQHCVERIPQCGPYARHVQQEDWMHMLEERFQHIVRLPQSECVRVCVEFAILISLARIWHFMNA